MTFLFRPGARSISVQQGAPREVILHPQLVVPVMPKVEVVEVEEVVQGLRDWLEKTGLLHLKAGIEAWAEEEGAAFLEEVTGNAADIAKALQLNKEESSRFQAKLKGLPAPKFAEASRKLARQKKLPIAPSPCPGCQREERMLWNVTIASQHEGWGRKWNECHYACQLCRRHISRDLHVNACRDCKVMWHGDCQQALAMDQAKKRVVPVPAASARKSCYPNKAAAMAVPIVPKVVQKAQASPAPLRTFTVPVPIAPGQQMAPVSIFDRRMSTPFTTEEMETAAKHVAKAYVPLQAWNFAKIPMKSMKAARAAPIEAPLTPNEVLIEDIEPLPGQLDRRILLETQRKLRADRRDAPVPEDLLRRRIPNPSELRHPMEEEMKEDREFRRDELYEKPGQKGFQGVRDRLMQTHGADIKNSLDQIFDGPVRLEKAEVAKPVQQKFMEAMGSGYPIIPTFHGSNVENYSSILQRGLLIPGRGNELHVVNGSVHGRGIYTARISNPQLSAGFCSDPKLLVCGVLDDAPGVANRSDGHFQVHAQSNAIKHVGDAVVIFDESRVVPLFQASAKTFSQPRWRAPKPGNQTSSATGWLGNMVPPSRPSQPSQLPASFNPNLPQPCAGMMDAGKGKIYHVRTRQIAFMPPTADTYRRNIEQKRIYEKKARDLRMKHRREEKMEQMQPAA